MRSRLFLHLLIILFSLVFPSSYLWFIVLMLIVNCIICFFCIVHIYWLLLLSLRNRYLDIDEIDLYSGISSKLMFLALAIPGVRDAFRYNPFHEIGGIYYWYFLIGPGYAYTLPFELYIVQIPYLIYGFMTGDWMGLGGNTGVILLMAANITIISLYVSLLYWKSQYRKPVAKALFLFGIVINILVLFFLSHSPLVYFTLIHLMYLALNAYRIHKIYKGNI